MASQFRLVDTFPKWLAKAIVLTPNAIVEQSFACPFLAHQCSITQAQARPPRRRSHSAAGTWTAVARLAENVSPAIVSPPSCHSSAGEGAGSCGAGGRPDGWVFRGVLRTRRPAPPLARQDANAQRQQVCEKEAEAAKLQTAKKTQEEPCNARAMNVFAMHIK